ncbi:MAG: sodium:proton antiporter [Lachnospiraceae bacterium]|nr:sodium:proton antiporter [Lachnospiraceae bacterium]
MAFVQNFPFFAIMLYLAGGVICAVLRPKAAKWYCLAVNGAVMLLLLATFFFVAGKGESYVYLMGHFPAPWGNEIRIGTLEALTGAAFAGVMLFSLLGGMEHIFEDCEPEKVNLYFTVICLLMSSLMALVFTNDLFTAYVFVEINTIASCALVMLKYNTGRPLIATARYLTMSLLGSSMFLIGIILLYSVSGHLLMEDIGEAVQTMFADGRYEFPLTVIIGLFSISMAIKSALFPFHAWLPDAHGSATATSSAVLSGLVLKGYIFLLIKIFYRVIGMNVIAAEHITNILFVFGALAMVAGSIRALQERDLKRMLAFSSVAQIGYIFLGIGMDNEAGMVAACIQILAHAFTKPMLFCAAGGFMSVSGGSKKMEDITGAGYRDPLGGAAFTVGALSMIGIPLFAGFVTKLHLTTAAVSLGGFKSVAGIAVIVVSTLLNALYYIPVIGNLYARPKDGRWEGVKARYHWEYAAAMVVFILLNLFYGICSGGFVQAIESGLGMFG